MDDPITVRCLCGWETSGPEDDVVAATQEHGRRLHNMPATREQILAMAAPAMPAVPSGSAGSGRPAPAPDPGDDVRPG